MTLPGHYFSLEVLAELDDELMPTSWRSRGSVDCWKRRDGRARVAHAPGATSRGLQAHSPFSVSGSRNHRLSLLSQHPTDQSSNLVSGNGRGEQESLTEFATHATKPQ